MLQNTPKDLAGIFDLYAELGGSTYVGEEVSQLEHAEQCAGLAALAGAPPHLVVAAFLHDIGHLLALRCDAHSGEDSAPRDDLHEKRGAALLARLLGEAVAAPVRLHVAAKRYLCATDPGYVAELSPASLTSLAEQGGALDARTARRFESVPGFDDAVALRRWDDLAKDPTDSTPRMSLEEVRALAVGIG